jgi:integrase
MPRQSKKLSALAVEKIKTIGWHSVGEGLWLQVKESGSRSWLFRYTLNGKAHGMGLGTFPTIPLAKAREKVIEYRALLAEGKDPIKCRKSNRDQDRLEAARTQTFKQCAEAYIESHRAAWRNVKHAAQWDTSLKSYVYPIIGNLSVQGIDVTLIMKVLEQKKEGFKGKKLWEAIPETANRIRNRIESILDWAAAREYRRGENPARWRGHLENLLPSRKKLKGVKHHAALPYSDIADFLKKLKKQKGIGIDAFEFLILTAARTGEVTGARWDEFDVDKKIWTIPADRIKAGREHRVPLSERAVKILQAIEKSQKNTEIDDKPPLVFWGRGGTKQLSKM